MLSILAILMITAFLAAVVLAFAWLSADRPRDIAGSSPVRPAGRRFLGV